jgi:hypothetical protein
MPISNFKRWMSKSSPEDKKAVAKRAKTTVPLLYQLGYETRKASNDLAARIEQASDGAVTRADLNSTCDKCPYFKECKK